MNLQKECNAIARDFTNAQRTTSVIPSSMSAACKAHAAEMRLGFFVQVALAALALSTAVAFLI